MHYRSDGDFAVPMVVRTPWGGGVHGALYHSQAIEAFYAHVPGLEWAWLGDGNNVLHSIIEAAGLMKFNRSEEHTSELPSLMRLSYAVFCLKNKTQHQTNNTIRRL